MAAPKPQTIVYKIVGNLKIELDIYLPDNAKNVPVFLWYHGGGLLQGDRGQVTPHHLRGVENNSYAFISADYRLAPQVGVQEILDDVKDGINFIRIQLVKHVPENSIDVNRLAVSGSSAGGYLAFLAGLYIEPKPKVILPIYPITDPLGPFFVNKRTPFMGNPTTRDKVEPFLDPNGEVLSRTEKTSFRNFLYFWMQQEGILKDLLHIKPDDDTFIISKQIYAHGLPPTYVVHGDVDTAVGVEQSDEVVGIMVGLGLEVEYERLHGVDHLFDIKEEVQLERMYNFFQKHI